MENSFLIEGALADETRTFQSYMQQKLLKPLEMGDLLDFHTASRISHFRHGTENVPELRIQLCRLVEASTYWAKQNRSARYRGNANAVIPLGHILSYDQYYGAGWQDLGKIPGTIDARDDFTVIGEKILSGATRLDGNTQARPVTVSEIEYVSQDGNVVSYYVPYDDGRHRLASAISMGLSLARVRVVNKHRITARPVEHQRNPRGKAQYEEVALALDYLSKEVPQESLSRIGIEQVDSEESAKKLLRILQSLPLATNSQALDVLASKSTERTGFAADTNFERRCLGILQTIVKCIHPNEVEPASENILKPEVLHVVKKLSKTLVMEHETGSVLELHADTLGSMLSILLAVPEIVGRRDFQQIATSFAKQLLTLAKI